jgi:hypothetical protein
VVVEFYNNSLGTYFVTADAGEVAILDTGVIPGWQRTGFNFKEIPAGDPRGLAACRFFGKPGSHFYTIDPVECAGVKTYPYWLYEGIAFNSDAPVGGTCAPDRVPVDRLYNNGMDGQASHRFVTSHSEVREMTQRGWIDEGTRFCGIP